MPIKANDNLTITETYLEKGDCVIKTERHIMAVVGGVVRDTLDSRFKRKPNARKRNAKLYHSPVLEVWAKPDRKHPVELTEELDGEYPRWTDTIAKEVTCNLIIRCQDREGNLDSETEHKITVFGGEKEIKHKVADYHWGYRLHHKRWNPLPGSGWFKQGDWKITMTLEGNKELQHTLYLLPEGGAA